MNTCAANGGTGAAGKKFYCRTLEALNRSKVPHLVGGAYALQVYTGIARDTKDLDLFVRPEDCERALEALAGTGCQTELTFPHWLGKAYCGEYFADIIFSSGNGAARVDDAWFERAVDAELLGVPVRLCPVEEMIWSKGYVQERERYDGADVAHLVRARAGQMDWRRLIDRFGPHWRVLFGHLVLFGFVYPAHRAEIPAWVMRELARRLEEETAAAPPEGNICRGTLLSREQYLIDIQCWGYRDARLSPEGNMSRAETDHWTAAIGDGKKS